MLDLPSGTVTFLFTDIEGSTALWEQDQVAMAVAEFPVNCGCRAIAESAVAPTQFP